MEAPGSEPSLGGQQYKPAITSKTHCILDCFELQTKAYDQKTTVLACVAAAVHATAATDDLKALQLDLVENDLPGIHSASKIPTEVLESEMRLLRNQVQFSSNVLGDLEKLQLERMHSRDSASASVAIPPVVSDTSRRDLHHDAAKVSPHYPELMQFLVLAKVRIQV